MGFLARSIFWLGLVYSSIPLDFASLISDRVPSAADLNPLAPCIQGAAEACRRRVKDLRKALDATSAPGAADRIASAPEVAKDKAPAAHKPMQSRTN